MFGTFKGCVSYMLEQMYNTPLYVCGVYKKSVISKCFPKTKFIVVILSVLDFLSFKWVPR
jgi:hypothetical protein